MAGHHATKHPIHLGLGASASVEPEFTGAMDWYAGYAERHAEDGIEGRLVTVHAFTEPWNVWEMHPKGSEVVLCMAGEMTLLQEASDGAVTQVTLAAGEYTINPPGVWHTADIESDATALFVTAGLGTEHRPRQ